MLGKIVGYGSRESEALEAAEVGGEAALLVIVKVLIAQEHDEVVPD